MEENNPGPLNLLLFHSEHQSTYVNADFSFLSLTVVISKMYVTVIIFETTSAENLHRILESGHLYKRGKGSEVG